jgi:hypothetical protein
VRTSAPSRDTFLSSLGFLSASHTRLRAEDAGNIETPRHRSSPLKKVPEKAHSQAKGPRRGQKALRQ